MAEIPSSDTPDELTHVAPERAPYLLALGRFAEAFAFAESQLSLLLWRLSGLPVPKAQALLAGFRLDAAKDMVVRLTEIEPLSAEDSAILKDMFSYLTEIGKIRNYLLHYGINKNLEGKTHATNFLKAFTLERVEQYEITPAILHAMARDLEKVGILFCFIGPVAHPRNELFDLLIRRPWLHRPGAPVRPYREPRRSSPKQPSPREPSPP